MHRVVDASLLIRELIFSVSRSSGPGGQHVNKVNTRVTVEFNVPQSGILTPDEKEQLLKRLAHRLTNEGLLLVSAQERRSQLQNKQAAIAKLDHVLKKALEKRKARKSTRPTRSSKQKRIEGKKLRGEKKRWRQKPG